MTIAITSWLYPLVADILIPGVNLVVHLLTLHLFPLLQGWEEVVEVLSGLYPAARLLTLLLVGGLFFAVVFLLLSSPQCFYFTTCQHVSRPEGSRHLINLTPWTHRGVLS